MVVDCDQCEMRDIACSDCVVTALLGRPPGRCEIGEPESRALRVLANAGLAAPLRLRVREQLRRAS